MASMVDMGAGWGMLIVETIAKVRRSYLVQKKSIKAICREFRLSRKVVRKVIRSEATEFRYERGRQPLPRIGPWRDQLDGLLLANEQKPARERLTLIRVFEELRGLGYEGGYDAMWRYARAWRTARGAATAPAYVPLSFAPGEAYQFDWSHEIVLMNRMPVTVKVAHIRLCHSRMPFVRAYPRESQEMVFDAHARAFDFFKGACTRRHLRQHEDGGRERLCRQGPPVQPPLLADVRALPSRADRLHAGGGLGEGTGREPGRQHPRAPVHAAPTRVASYDELNAWLLEQCIAHAKTNRHPEQIDRTIWQVFEAERPQLVPIGSRFDGFRATQASVSKTCLVRFDSNKYSVASRAVGRPVEIQAYAERIVIRQDGVVVGDHVRCSGRNQTIYDPWHYVPVLARKPGALRNGAPFKDWLLPANLERVHRWLKGSDDGDRQMVKILAAVLTDGLAAVEAACAEAVTGGVHSADVVLNILARHRDPGPAATILAPEALRLREAPIADCARYDRLRRAD